MGCSWFHNLKQLGESPHVPPKSDPVLQGVIWIHNDQQSLWCYNCSIGPPTKCLYDLESMELNNPHTERSSTRANLSAFSSRFGRNARWNPTNPSLPTLDVAACVARLSSSSTVAVAARSSSAGLAQQISRQVEVSQPRGRRGHHVVEPRLDSVQRPRRNENGGEDPETATLGKGEEKEQLRVPSVFFLQKLTMLWGFLCFVLGRRHERSHGQVCTCL